MEDDLTAIQNVYGIYGIADNRRIYMGKSVLALSVYFTNLQMSKPLVRQSWCKDSHYSVQGLDFKYTAV